MTKRLEEVFDLPSEIAEHAKELNFVLDDNLTDLTKSDAEMDELAAKAMTTFNDLMDLGMNVEARFAAPIFEAATKMMGHAITAKTNKIDKKLKLMDLKLKEKKLEQQLKTEDNTLVEGNARILDRNELFKILKSNE